MSQIPPIPPGAATTPSKTESIQAKGKSAGIKSGGTFNHVINVLNGISGNEAWLLKLFKEWLGDLKQFSNLLNSLSSAIEDITSKNPVNPEQDAKTIIKDLNELRKLPGQLKAKLTKMMKAKYGTPLPAKAKNFIKEATDKLQKLVDMVKTKLKDMEKNASEPAKGFAYFMLLIMDGKKVVPVQIEKVAAKVRAHMHTKDGKLTPTWYSINGLEGTLTQADQGAEFLNSAVSAREQQVANEIQSVFTGISKTIDKQFKTIMMMVRGILSR